MVGTCPDPGVISILAKLPDAVLLADDERRYVFANSAAAELLETPVDEIVGRRIDDFAHESKLEAEWSSFVDQGKKAGPFCLRTPAGHVRYVHFNAVTHLMPGLHLSVLRDVTAEYEAQLQQQQNQRLSELALNAAQMGCWHYSLLTNQSSFTPVLQQLFDFYEHATPSYEDFLSKLHPEDISIARNLISETLLNGERYEVNYRVICRDGACRWLIDRGEVLFDSARNRIGISGVVWDITEQRAREQEHQSRLRDLARSNLDLQRFAHVASHDLKEPLRNVCALSELLSRQSAVKLDEDERDVLEMIVSSAKRMATLIDSMLAYAKSGLRREFVLKPCSSREIVDDALSNLRLTIEQTGAAFHVDDLPVVMGSRSDLVQVFQNLISNAIKYCSGEPEIYIGAQRQNEVWVFSVRDNGIGVEAEHREHIFEMFTRLHMDDYPGTGAGLAICKAIIEKHAGRIWVEPAAPRGSNFLFTLPA